MVTEDYVSFEIAMLLKEKGFDSNCDKFWRKGFIIPTFGVSYDFNNPDGYDNVNDYQADCSAPTLQRALKFIRQKYNYHIIATPEYGDVEYMPGQWQEEFLGWKYTIIPLEGSKSLIHPTVYAKTQESACEEGIKFLLNYDTKES